MTADEHRKPALFDAIAVMGNAFASPRRLELLDLLAQAPRSVDQLARASRQSVAGEEALRLWLALRDTSVQQLAEVDRSARDYLGEEVKAIDAVELVARMRRNDVVLVDVRSPEEFEAGHIEGARSIPLGELEEALEDLDGDREVIAYCRGPFCVMAHEAVRRLQAAGLAARRLEGGWPDWKLSNPKSTATAGAA